MEKRYEYFLQYSTGTCGRYVNRYFRTARALARFLRKDRGRYVTYIMALTEVER